MASTDISNDLPRVLITSTKIEKAKEIATNMGGKYFTQEADVDHYVLNIDNKYYTAQIALCTTQNLSIDPANYEALIFHYDIESESTLKMVDELLTPILSQTDAEILLLISHSILDSIVKGKAVEWCAQKKCELIELDAKEIMELEEDQSKYGIERIIEALETHMWPNINMKDSRKNYQQPQSDVNDVGEQLENVQLSSAQGFADRLQMESVLDGIMNNDEADFGELFGKLRAMKEHAASMPSNQRRLAAEHLVTAFWKAIGGDPAEVDDIE
ncbi:alpha- and gamma-adaptin-binding protein p34-like [Phymastichus coffea]|uniref:alpha- and gamma-adaptin-binding protein p34-like n=1 Tax=Phymastichus coffea TaxID=108790 RepID=UPI00273CF424|nr:alpha- and gamma-adaptin-binding protein p34-like [Phymastichus coffea]